MNTNEHSAPATPSMAPLVRQFPQRLERDVAGLKVVFLPDKFSDGSMGGTLSPRYELSPESVRLGVNRFKAVLQGEDVGEAVKLGYGLIVRLDEHGTHESWNIHHMSRMNVAAEPIMSQMKHNDKGRYEELKQAFARHPYRWDLWED